MTRTSALPDPWPPVLTAITHFAGVIIMLKSAAAIATIPKHAASAFAQSTGLTTSPPPIPMPAFLVSLVWHGDRSQDPTNAWLRDQIRTIAHPADLAA